MHCGVLLYTGYVSFLYNQANIKKTDLQHLQRTLNMTPYRGEMSHFQLEEICVPLV